MTTREITATTTLQPVARAMPGRRTLAIAAAVGCLIAAVALAPAGAIVVACHLPWAALSGVLALTDARTHRLPNKYTLAAFGSAVVALPTLVLLTGQPVARLVPVVIGAAALGGAYWLMATIGPRSLGGGDVKLAPTIGAYLGYLGLFAVWAGTLAGFVLAAVYGIGAMITRRATRRTHHALGPWIITGAWLTTAAYTWIPTLTSA